MEVHHNPKVEKKNFKEYFLEGIMIFIAVSLGFLAESLRLNIADRREIKSDMQSLVADLNSDVMSMDSGLARNEYKCLMIDTLIDLLKNSVSNTSEIYFLARNITANDADYFVNDEAFQQMKSSDALKLIEPRSLLDSISNYYSSFHAILSENELQMKKLDDVHQGNDVLFDGSIFQKMFQQVHESWQHGHLIVLHKPKGNPPLLTNDFAKINSVIMKYHYYDATSQFNNQNAHLQRQHAARLIDLIKKQYSSD